MRSTESGERKEKRSSTFLKIEKIKNRKRIYTQTNDPRTAAALAVTVDFLCQSKIKCHVLQKTLWMELVIIAE